MKTNVHINVQELIKAGYKPKKGDVIYLGLGLLKAKPFTVYAIVSKMNNDDHCFLEIINPVNNSRQIVNASYYTQVREVEILDVQTPVL